MAIWSSGLRQNKILLHPSARSDGENGRWERGLSSGHQSNDERSSLLINATHLSSLTIRIRTRTWFIFNFYFPPIGFYYLYFSSSFCFEIFGTFICYIFLKCLIYFGIRRSLGADWAAPVVNGRADWWSDSGHRYEESRRSPNRTGEKSMRFSFLLTQETQIVLYWLYRLLVSLTQTAVFLPPRD